MRHLLSAPARQAADWLNRPVQTNQGVNGFLGWKFVTVLFLYVAGFAAFSQDPFFGERGFVYAQGIMTLLVAFILVAAVAWELCLLGQAHGANFFLQLVLCLPFGLFMARIIAAPTDPIGEGGLVPAFLSDLAGATAYFTGISRMIAWIPAWVRDIFVHLNSALFLILVLGVLSLRQLRLKISLLLSLLLINFVTALTEAPDADSVIWLATGTLLMLGGIAIQYCRFDRVVFYRNVVNRLCSGPIGETEFRTILRLATLTWENGRLSEEAVRAVVKSEYADSAGEWRLIAAEITRRMVFEYQIMRLAGDHNGMFLLVNEPMCRYENLLGDIAVWPRVVLTLVIVLIWVLLPIDLLPDAIPFLGMLDDVAVSLLAGMVVKNAVERS